MSWQVVTYHLERLSLLWMNTIRAMVKFHQFLYFLSNFILGVVKDEKNLIDPIDMMKLAKEFFVDFQMTT